MKVIQVPPTFKQFEFDCDACKARLLVESQDDLRRCSGGDQRDSWDYLIALCPFCSQSQKFNLNIVPVHILRLIKSL